MVLKFFVGTTPLLRAGNSRHFSAKIQIKTPPVSTYLMEVGGVSKLPCNAQHQHLMRGVEFHHTNREGTKYGVVYNQSCE